MTTTEKPRLHARFRGKLHKITTTKIHGDRIITMTPPEGKTVIVTKPRLGSAYCQCQSYPGRQGVCGHILCLRRIGVID